MNYIIIFKNKGSVKNLDYLNEIELRSQLIYSTIRILNNMQMDINIAIISYITKIPFIFSSVK